MDYALIDEIEQVRSNYRFYYAMYIASQPYTQNHQQAQRQITALRAQAYACGLDDTYIDRWQQVTERAVS